MGMLCRNYTEEDVKAMFGPYGHVEDVSILRNADGRSKGLFCCPARCVCLGGVD